MSRESYIERLVDHILVLYDSAQEREQVICRYISTALGQGKMVICASLDRYTEVMGLRASIKDLENYLRRGKLKIIDINDFCEGPTVGNSHSLKELRASLEADLSRSQTDAKTQGVVIVASCVENLSMDEKFEECCRLERSLQEIFRLWTSKGMQVSIICPHLRSVLDEGEKAAIAANHTTILYAES